jgi:hypothetical protein
LEARLVLSEAARLGLQPLLSHAEQLGKPASADPTIDSVVKNSKPKADLPVLDSNVLLGSTESAPAAAHSVPQESLTDGPAAIVHPPISQSIEASVATMAPSEMTDVAKALEAFGLQASQAVGVPVANLPHTPPSPLHKIISPPTPDAAPPAPREANTPSPTPDAANSNTAQPTDRTPPPERAAPPESTNANVGLAQAAAEAEQASSAPPTVVAQSVETQFRQGAPPVIGQGVSYLVNPGRFVDGYAVQQRIYDSQELPAADFTALPSDEATRGGLPSPIDRLALLSESDGETLPAPSSGDLILNFLPCNVAALRTAIENFLTESEQALLSSTSREGLALGLFIAALVASGMAGHAVWEHVRGRRERAGSSDWPDAWALTRNLAVGLQLSEMP